MSLQRVFNGLREHKAEAADYVTSGLNSDLHYRATSSGFPALAVLLEAVSLGVPVFDVVCGVQPCQM